MIRNFAGVCVTGVVHNGFNDVWDALKTGVSTISDFFSNVGEWCGDVLNAALNVFSSLVYSSVNVLTADPESELFSDFWTVVNRVSSVLGVIASTLIVLLFVFNMATDAWDSRHELDLWGTMKMIVKMLVAVIIVNNAVKIVTAIFSMGARIAGLVVASGDEGLGNAALSEEYYCYFKFCVSGFSGVIVFLVYLLGAVVIIVSAVTICMEIYQRIFKIYILIPFSTISFTTFVMGDGNRGNEVFHGYLKSILSTAAEAVIIMVCVVFTGTLVTHTDTMDNLFPAFAEMQTEQVAYYSEEDLMALVLYVNHDASSLAILSGSDGISISDSVTNFINNSSPSDYATVVDGMGRVWRSGDLLATLARSTQTGISDSLSAIINASQDGGHLTATIYPIFSWKTMFMILLQLIFPCTLCAGAVKAVSNYSGMILGR